RSCARISGSQTIMWFRKNVIKSRERRERNTASRSFFRVRLLVGAALIVYALQIGRVEYGRRSP
ncbi:MAG: hypothetical protein WCA56_12165, partial [Xanthobacteraceae bacterium]